MITMADFGVGVATSYVVPTGTTVLRVWLDGAGGGGGGGGPAGGGGGGGSGMKCYWVFRGPLGGLVLSVVTGVGGAGGAGGVSGGVPGANGQHTTVAFQSIDFAMIAGGAEGGAGQPSVATADYDPQRGGRGGNASHSGTPPASGLLPGTQIQAGQFNIGSCHGQSGGPTRGGRGGHEGDTSGGGRGGDAGQSGQDAQGGYVHLECE